MQKIEAYKAYDGSIWEEKADCEAQNARLLFTQAAQTFTARHFSRDMAEHEFTQLLIEHADELRSLVTNPEAYNQVYSTNRILDLPWVDRGTR